MKTQTCMHPQMTERTADGKTKCLHWINVTCALRLPPTCDSKAAIPPCEVGTLTVTILLLAGNGSLVVTTFPPTEVPVIWKVCPLDVATVVSVPATHKANKQRNYNKYCYYSNPWSISTSNKPLEPSHWSTVWKSYASIRKATHLQRDLYLIEEGCHHRLSSQPIN